MWCNHLFWSLAEYNIEDIPEIYLAVEEHPWDPSTEEYSEHETYMLDHQGQIIHPTTAARGQILISTIISYLLAYDTVDPGQQNADWYSQKTVSKAYSLGWVMGNNPWCSQDDYLSHNPKRDFDSTLPFIIQMIQNKWEKSLSLLHGPPYVFRHDVCQYSVQKGQQCTCMCHRLRMC